MRTNQEPERRNLYLSKELLEQCKEDKNASKTITQALKLAYERREDFIQYTRRRLSGASDSVELLELDDIIRHDKLIYNMFIRKQGFSAFLQKGHFAAVLGGRLDFGNFQVELNSDVNLHLHFSKLKNDFGGDMNCIELSFDEVSADGR